MCRVAGQKQIYIAPKTIFDIGVGMQKSRVVANVKAGVCLAAAGAVFFWYGCKSADSYTKLNNKMWATWNKWEKHIEKKEWKEVDAGFPYLVRQAETCPPGCDALDPMYVYRDMAGTYSKRGDTARAFEEYSRLIEKYNYYEAYYERGEINYARGRHIEALEDYERYQKLRPKGGYSSSGRSYYDGTRTHDKWFNTLKKDRYQTAIKGYTEQIRKNPNSAELFYARGYFRSLRNEHREAIDDMGAALRLDPSLAKAYEIRAVEYYKNGELEKCVGDYSALIRMEPQNPEWRSRRANIRPLLDDCKGAIEDITFVIMQDTADADNYLWRARIFSRDGRHGEAISDISHAITLLEGKAQLGYKGYIESGSEAWGARNRLPSAYRQRGNARTKAAQYDAAIDDFNIILGFAEGKTDISDKWDRLGAMLDIADVHFLRAEYGKALEICNELLAEEQWGRVYRTREKTYYKLGFPEKARADSVEAAKQDSILDASMEQFKREYKLEYGEEL